MNFTNDVSADMGPSGSANSQELGRASGQDAVLDSSLTNGHLPSEGNQGVSDGRPPSFLAPLQCSQAGYGTRERGDGARGPERQASYNRWALRQQTATTDNNNSFTFTCCMVLWDVKDVCLITDSNNSFTFTCCMVLWDIKDVCLITVIITFL